MIKNKLISRILLVPMISSLFVGIQTWGIQTVQAAIPPISSNFAFTSKDIGSVGIPGSATYYSALNEFTVTGSGITQPTTTTTSDPDGLQFVSLGSMVNGDSTIIAKVSSFDIGGAANANFGLMVRASLDSKANDPLNPANNFAASIIQPQSSSTGGAISYIPAYEYRDTKQSKPTTIGAPGSAVSTANDGSFYLKLAYQGSKSSSGSTLTSAPYLAYFGKVDASGNIQWTIAKTGTKSAVSNSYYIGLAVNSNDPTKTVKVKFDNVTIENSYDTSSSTVLSSLDGMSIPVWGGKGTLTPSVAANGDCTFNWNAAYDNFGVTKYNIYQGSNLVGSTANGNTTTYTVTKSSMLSIDPNFDPTTKAYNFTVQAVDAAGNISTDGPSTSTDITSPTWSSATLSATTVTQNKITLSWSGATDNVGITSYKLYDITSSTTPSAIAVIDGNTTSYSVRNLKPSTSYKFKVEAVDSTGNCSTNGPSISTATTAPVFDNTVPTWTSGKLSASNIAQNSVTLTWTEADDNVGVDGYNIYQGSSTTPIATVDNTINTYNVTKLTPGTNYTFTVQAVDASANLSVDGPKVTIMTPEAPKWQAGTVSASSIINVQPNATGPIYTAVQNDSTTLTWSGAVDPVGITSYIILESGKIVATVDGDVNTYTVAGLTPGQTYNFEVEASDAAACYSTDGPKVTLTMVAANNTLLPPQNLSVPALAYDDKSITLVWTKPDNYASSSITDYNVYMDGKKIGNANNNVASAAKAYVDSFYSDATNSAAAKISNHSYVVTGLTPNTSHTFTVRSVDASGKESIDSNTVTQATTAVPKIFDVTSYGAKGDGTTIDTAAIQAAIDACTPGGKVLFPAGKTFKSGTVWIKSNMTLEVDGNLVASDKAEDFPYPDPDFKSVQKSASLISTPVNATDLENIRIVGTGKIDGNGWKQGSAGTDGFPQSLASSSSTVTTNGILAAAQYNLAVSKGFNATDAYSTRSNLITLGGVTNVYLGDGLSIVNPSQHALSVSSYNVTLNRIKVMTYDCNNGDGIDMSGSGLIVVNSVFDTGDDDINFAAGVGAAAERERSPVQNIWVFDNYFRRGHGAVVAGSNTAAWIQNILAEDNVMNGIGVALRCKTGTGVGGGARNIVFRDSAVKNVTDGDQYPFEFTSGYPSSTSDPAPDMGRFKHIFINNVTIDTSTKNGIFVSGVAGTAHEDIHFTNVSFKNTPAASINYMRNSSFNNVLFNSTKFTTTSGAISNSTGLVFDKYITGSTTSGAIQITSVDLPNDIIVKQGDKLTLPSFVTAHYSDNSTKAIAVQWNGAVDTSKIGKQTIQGTVAGFTGSISVNVIVSADTASKDFTVNTAFDLSSLQPNKMLNGHATITNNNSSINSVLVIMALYDDSDRMINMCYISKNIPVGNTENLSTGFKLPENTANYKVDMFVWDGTNLNNSTMQPIANVIELK